MLTLYWVAFDFPYGWLEQHNLTGETLLSSTSATDLPLSLCPSGVFVVSCISTDLVLYGLIKVFSIKPADGIHQWKYWEKSVSVFVQSL